MKLRSYSSLLAAWILALLVGIPFLTQNPSSATFAQTPAPAKADTATSATSALGFNIDEIMADADKPLFIRYGIFGGVTLNYQFPNFTDVGGFLTEARPLTRSLNVSSENFVSYYAGALFEYPILNRLGVSLRASFSNVGGGMTLSGRENLLVPSPTTTTTPFLLEIDHTLKIDNMLMIAGEPYLTYRVLDALTLYAGVRFGYLLNPKISFEERISADNPVRFLDSATQQRSTVRNQRSGIDIPNLRPLNIGLSGGLSYEIPLDPNGKWLAAIEGFYVWSNFSQVADSLTIRQPQSTFNGLSVTRNVSPDERGTDRDPQSAAWPTTTSLDGSWFFNNVRASIAIRYSPFRTIRPELTPAMQETFKQIKRIDSAIAVERVQNQKRLAQVDSINTAIAKKVEELKKVGISVTITKVVGIDENGKELPGKPKLVVEQFRKSVTQPILPAIFFDEGSYTIPSKYRRLKAADRGTFKMSDLAGKSNYEIYRHTLNIIGKRMEENPAAVLFVTGCNANIGSELGNQKLSEQRAQSISDYLQDAWKIQAKRIIVQKRDLPENPANSAEPTGAAENRRVDLSSTLPELLAPVVSDVIAKIPNPPTIRFGLEINAGAGLKQWNFETTQFQEDEVATVFQRTGTNTYPQQLDWGLAQEANTVPSSGQDLTVQLSMTDINNKTGDAPLVSIPVEQINVQKKELEAKGDKRIDWFDILGFTGGMNPGLDETNQKVLESIKSKLKPDATVSISAYTDNTGDAAQNKQLAQKRADFIAKALGVPSAKINAVGPTTMQDNNNPEGRMYNRFVRVEVLTPVTK
jgi:outer membrane protein OmpA-like peptidoglycan-associated protein